MRCKLTQLTKPLRIPACWRDLLAMELDFMDMGVPTFSAPLLTPAADPQPYRQDSRVAVVQDQGYHIRLMLVSGVSNYWVEYVAFGPGGEYAHPDTFYELPDKEDSVYFSYGTGVSFSIEYY